MSSPALPEGGPPGTELTGISFRDQLWLNTFPLERNLVFDYFALSPFYDRSCNNEQLRMRSIHPLDISHLSKMTGIEYMLYEVQEPNLFVFRKQKRDSAEKVTPTSAYYILDGSIYQAPNLHNVIGSRVVRALYHISKAFTEASTKLEKIGYGEKQDNEPERPRAESKGPIDAKKSVEIYDMKEAFRIDQILGAIQRKLPPTPALPPLMLVEGVENVAPVASTQSDGVQPPPTTQQTGVDASMLGKQSKTLAAEPPAKRVKAERI